MDVLINQLSEYLSTLIITNLWFAPFLALVAGVLTSFTPCALTSVPLVIGYVGGVGNSDTKNAFKLSILFAVGMAVTFTILGTAASLLGKLMQGSGSWWYLFLGVLMLLMALQTLEIFNFIPSINLLNKNKKRGLYGAFLAGIMGGMFSSPCATPVLVVLLAIVAKEGNLLWGLFLLLLYSIGHSILVIIAGTSVGFVQKISSNSRYGVISKILKYIMGIMILFLSFYMFYLGF